MSQPKENPNDEHQVDRLLSDWQRSRERRILGLKLFASVAFVALIGLAVFEWQLFGTFRIVAFEALLVAGVLVVALALGYSAFLFWLGWNAADGGIRKGMTRPSVGQMVLIFLLCALAALPFSAMVHSEKAPLHETLGILGFLIWINASATLLGYGARFYSEMRRSR